MSKFDQIYEEISYTLTEREYINSTFQDNVGLLLKVLQDNDFISSEREIEDATRAVMEQPKHVKEIVLDPAERSLPAIKLLVKQETDSESFSVTVVNLEKPDEQKQFNNSMLETIFDDVIEYIETTALQGLKPEANVNELPQSQGANAQPGGGESALPTERPQA
jgi:hypothetical protein